MKPMMPGWPNRNFKALEIFGDPVVSKSCSLVLMISQLFQQPQGVLVAPKKSFREAEVPRSPYDAPVDAKGVSGYSMAYG